MDRREVIVLCGYGWEDVVTSVAWQDHQGIMVRILASNGTWFERRSDSRSLTEEWSLESSYSFYRPIVVSTLQEGVWLLGNDVSVLDAFPEGRLEAPTYRWRFDHL